MFISVFLNIKTVKIIFFYFDNFLVVVLCGAIVQPPKVDSVFFHFLENMKKKLYFLIF